MARVRQASARIARAALLPRFAGYLDANRQGRAGGSTDVQGNRFTAGLSAS